MWVVNCYKKDGLETFTKQWKVSTKTKEKLWTAGCFILAGLIIYFALRMM